MFFVDSLGNLEEVYGRKSCDICENVIKTLLSGYFKKDCHDHSWDVLFR